MDFASSRCDPSVFDKCPIPRPRKFMRSLNFDPLETVSKNSAWTSKTHNTVNKKNDGRHKTYDSARDCQQKQRRNWQNARYCQQKERSETQNIRFLPRLSAKCTIWSQLERPGPEKPNSSKTAGCQIPYKILCKMLAQTRFQASGSPGTVFEVPGDSSQRRRQAILTRLSAKAAPGLTKIVKMHETVNKKKDGRHKTYDSARDCQQKQRRNWQNARYCQ